MNNLRDLGFTDDDLAPDGGSDAFVDALVAWGDVDAVVRRVREHLDAGADHVAVQVLRTQKRGVPDARWRELAAPFREIPRGAVRSVAGVAGAVTGPTPPR